MQIVPGGRSAVGLSVMVLVPEPLTANVCRFPGLGHSMVKELVEAFTGSVNGIVMLVFAATPVAPEVGVVGGATAGGASIVKVSVKLSPSTGVLPSVDWAISARRRWVFAQASPTHPKAIGVGCDDDRDAVCGSTAEARFPPRS